ncbi:BMP family ABC transporter substrate-binding protein [Mycoplasma sp. 1232]|uniref:BMP family ABC transporter substrate-binding protein n=1 Tax=Mycoplasma sp. 1232 TaxID=3108527 RepID=UPI002B25EA6C|nr:BMP family ABC transporter substrate-binding protein [Mycoplasma sp. 1232]MEA4333627.1 BMP family ABC transporter substrate-binding protein [Mycoplasma sp. 1232]
MKKIKSLLLAVAGITTAIAPVAAISCGQKDWSFITEVKLNDRVTKEVVEDPAKPALRAIVVTDAGHVTDKSFNQSSYEGLLKYEYQVRELTGAASAGSKMEPETGKYESAYSSLLGKYDIWILSGFTHKEKIEAFIKSHKAEMIAKKVKVIGVDFTINPDNLDGFADFYGLEFKVAESAYIVGKAVAEFISTDDSFAYKRNTTSFGGGEFDGVVDFIKGYYRGIVKYNSTVSEADKKVRATQTAIDLATGFEPNDAMKNVIEKSLATKPTVILPVAGPATTLTLGKIKSSSELEGIDVIGVDTDQSKISKNFAGKFYTSITKNISQAVYDTIIYITYGIDTKGLFTAKEPTKSFNIKGDFKQGWVGYAKSTLKDEAKRAKLNELLAKSETEFRALSNEDINFISSYKLNSTDSDDMALKALVQALAAEMNK